MKKGHISRVILQFVFILLFISCKNKNNDIIIVKNVDKVNNEIIPVEYIDKINNDLSTEIHFCKIHNQEMYKENKIRIIYGLPDFDFWENKYPEIREKYFPNCSEIKFGGCFVGDETYFETTFESYVCNICNKERDKYLGIK